MIKPYYQHNGITIYHGDCLEIMPQFDPVDLVVTDPPYGVRKKEKWDDTNYFKNNLSAWLKACSNLSRTTVWFCADKMLPAILKDNEDTFHRILVWNKPSGSQFAGAMHSNIWYSIEIILVFGEYPKTDKSKRYGFACLTDRTIAKKTFNHPTAKPEWLMKELIYFYSNKGDTIVDPFMGSGSSLVSAKLLGRKAIGIERERAL